MRILVVANGASIHTRRWLTGLAARGHEVALATDVPGPDPVRTFALPPLYPGRLNLPWLVAQLRRGMRRYRPELVHAHYASHYGVLAAWARAVPLVVSVWGADVEVFPRRHVVNRRMLQSALARAQVVTATSHYLASAAAPYLARGKAAVVVPFGIDTTRFQPGPGPRAFPPLIVCNKHLEEAYGPDVLLAALDLLPPLRWQLELLGSGSWEARIQSQVAAGRWRDRIRLLGAVAPDVVAERLKAATLAVYPSRRESFGVATLEAEATGVPVVATTVGGLPEVVADGLTGWLVPPDDPAALAGAMTKILTSADQGQAMGASGRRLVLDQYTWPAALDAMEAVYRTVAARP